MCFVFSFPQQRNQLPEIFSFLIWYNKEKQLIFNEIIDRLSVKLLFDWLTDKVMRGSSSRGLKRASEDDSLVVDYLSSFFLTFQRCTGEFIIWDNGWWIKASSLFSFIFVWNIRKKQNTEELFNFVKFKVPTASNSFSISLHQLKANGEKLKKKTPAGQQHGSMWVSVCSLHRGSLRNVSNHSPVMQRHHCHGDGASPLSINRQEQRGLVWGWRGASIPALSLMHAKGGE